jgi:hypothetical protein
MALALTLTGRFPVVTSVGSTQLDVTISEWERLWTVYHLGKTSTGGASNVDVFALLDNTTGTVATTYASSNGSGKAVIQSGISFPLPHGIKTAQFKTASGSVALQFVASQKGNYATT